MTTRRTFLLLIVFWAALQSVSCMHHVARRSVQAVPKLSQCTWDSSGWPRFCFPTHAALVAKNQSKIVRPINYAARAQAFLVAGKAYCSQFSLDLPSCTWPCQNNGIECTIAGELSYTVWDCPESKARAFYTCSQQPHLTPAWCGLLPACTYTKNPTSGLRKCEASFYLNLTTTQRRDFGPAYFVRMAREYTGCCLASNYRWKKQFSCATANDVEDSCGQIPGCYFYPDLLKCSPSQEQLIKNMFAQDATDPVAAHLTAIAQECIAITDSDQCNSYKPVEVDKEKLLYYMNQDLDIINTEVNDTECLPQPSTSSSTIIRKLLGLHMP